jgi:hypothetical protein
VPDTGTDPVRAAHTSTYLPLGDSTGNPLCNRRDRRMVSLWSCEAQGMECNIEDEPHISDRMSCQIGLGGGWVAYGRGRSITMHVDCSHSSCSSTLISFTLSDMSMYIGVALGMTRLLLKNLSLNIEIRVDEPPLTYVVD